MLERRLHTAYGIGTAVHVPLKCFEGAIDVLVQINGGVACPIWDPLRVAITVKP